MKINDVILNKITCSTEEAFKTNALRIVDILIANGLPDNKLFENAIASLSTRDEIELVLILASYAITKVVTKATYCDVKLYQDYRKVLISISDWCKCALRTKLYSSIKESKDDGNTIEEEHSIGNNKE